METGKGVIVRRERGNIQSLSLVTYSSSLLQ